MENITPEELRNKLESLPAEVKEAIKATRVNQKILDLAQRYELHIDESESLKVEVTLLLCGLTLPGNFIKNISETIGMSQEDASVIAAEINESIFLPIRKYLVDKSSRTAEPQMTKESILSEIEDPRPTTQPNVQPKPIAPTISPKANYPVTPTPKPSSSTTFPTPPSSQMPPKPPSTSLNQEILKSFNNPPKPSSPIMPPPRPQSAPTSSPTIPNTFNAQKTIPTPPRPPIQPPNNPNLQPQKPYTGPQTSENQPKNYPTDPYREQSK